MKKSIILFSLYCIAVVLFLSCDPSVPTHAKYIPGDVTGIVSVKLERLMTKSGASDELRATVLEKFDTSLPSEFMEPLEPILKDGIDLKQDLYLFFHKNGPNNGHKGGLASTLGFVAKVGDVKKLKEAFATLVKEGSKGGNGWSLEEKEGYSKVIAEGVVFVFKEDVLIGVFSSAAGTLFSDSGQLAEDMILERFSENAGGSFAEKEVFKKIVADDKDISIAILTTDVLDLAQGLNKNIALWQNLYTDFDYSNTYLIANMNAEKGVLSFSSSTYPLDTENMKQLQALTSFFSKLSNRFLDYYPSNTLLYFAMHANGEDLFKYYDKTGVWGMLKTLYGDIKKEEIQRLASSFLGETAFGLTGISLSSMPSLALYSEVKDDYAFRTLIDFLKNEPETRAALLETTADNYEVDLGLAKIYFGLKDKTLYVTTDEITYKNLFQKAWKPLSSHESSKGLREAYAAFVINVEEITALLVVQAVLEENLYKCLSEFSYIELLSETQNKGVANFYFKNKKDNSLKILANYLFLFQK